MSPGALLCLLVVGCVLPDSTIGLAPSVVQVTESSFTSGNGQTRTSGVGSAGVVTTQPRNTGGGNGVTTIQGSVSAGASPDGSAFSSSSILTATGEGSSSIILSTDMESDQTSVELSTSGPDGTSGTAPEAPSDGPADEPATFQETTASGDSTFQSVSSSVTTSGPGSFFSTIERSDQAVVVEGPMPEAAAAVASVEQAQPAPQPVPQPAPPAPQPMLQPAPPAPQPVIAQSKSVSVSGSFAEPAAAPVPQVVQVEAQAASVSAPVPQVVRVEAQAASVSAPAPEPRPVIVPAPMTVPAPDPVPASAKVDLMAKYGIDVNNMRECRGAADWKCCDVQDFESGPDGTFCGCSTNLRLSGADSGFCRWERIHNNPSVWKETRESVPDSFKFCRCSNSGYKPCEDLTDRECCQSYKPGNTQCQCKGSVCNYVRVQENPLVWEDQLVAPGRRCRCGF